ncbi:MAG TPA: hypothetical protein VJZ00_14390 [Thermoanaerobaculia bacterium]|nr:hypothetical protein [Thermoanaerobaculia bacterium]
MRRTALAAAWILGATLPLLGAAVLLFGCCVLPFHRVVHKAMPMCMQAIEVLRGSASHDHDKQTPAQEKQEPVKRIATRVTRTIHVAAPSPAPRRIAPIDRVAYRSFIAFGAIRCDRDVGLHLLDRTLLV